MDVREIAKQNVLMQDKLFIQYQVSLSSVLMSLFNYMEGNLGKFGIIMTMHAWVCPNQILYIQIIP